MAYHDSQLIPSSAQGRRTTSFGATTLVSAQLLWNPSGFPVLDPRKEDDLLWSYNFDLGSVALESFRIPSSWLKVGGRPPLELQLWSLSCFGILRHIRIPSSFPALSSRQEDDLLWSYNFGLGSAVLVSFKIPSSWLKVGGRPPLELQLWSQLGCFGISGFPAHSQLSAQGRRTTSFGATTLVSARLFWNPSGFPALGPR